MRRKQRDKPYINYRIDDKPAQSARWSKLTSNKGAGFFGEQSEIFLRDIYDAEKIFIRLTENGGKIHDANFKLAGVQEAIESVANGCGWSTLKLTRDDYRAIQTLLNAGGYDAGTPDGIWGERSRKAMRNFQEDTGIAPTGVPDRSTMESMDFSEVPKADLKAATEPKTIDGKQSEPRSAPRAQVNSPDGAGGSLESFEAKGSLIAQSCLERAGAFRPADHFTGVFAMRLDRAARSITIQGRPHLSDGVVPPATLGKIESGLSNCPEFMQHLTSRPNISELNVDLKATGLRR